MWGLSWLSSLSLAVCSCSFLLVFEWVLAVWGACARWYYSFRFECTHSAFGFVAQWSVYVRAGVINMSIDLDSVLDGQVADQTWHWIEAWHYTQVIWMIQSLDHCHYFSLYFDLLFALSSSWLSRTQVSLFASFDLVWSHHPGCFWFWAEKFYGVSNQQDCGPKIWFKLNLCLSVHSVEVSLDLSLSISRFVGNVARWVCWGSLWLSEVHWLDWFEHQFVCSCHHCPLNGWFDWILNLVLHLCFTFSSRPLSVHQLIYDLLTLFICHWSLVLDPSGYSLCLSCLAVTHGWYLFWLASH